MNKSEFLLLLDELMEEEPGTLEGPELLRDLDGWDSMSSLGFMALVDEHFDFTVNPQKLTECKTVSDLLSLLDDRLTK